MPTDNGPEFWLSWLNSKRDKLSDTQLRDTLRNIVSRIDSGIYGQDPILIEIYLERIRLEREVADYKTISNLYRDMVTSKIGTTSPELYLSWADYEDCCGNSDRATRILKAAIQLKIDDGSLKDALDLLQARGKENKIPLESKAPCSKILNQASISDLRKQATPAPAVNRIPLSVKRESSAFPPPTPIGRVFPFKEPSSVTTDGENTMQLKARRNLGPPSRRITSSDANEPLSPESMTAASPHLGNSSDESSFQRETPGSSPSFERSLNVKTTENLSTIKNGTNELDSSVTVKRQFENRALEAETDTIVPLNDLKDKKTITVNGKEYMRSQLIGKGGSCKVFKIIDENGHVYALKKVKLKGQDASVIKGYKNEIILLNKLKNSKRIIHLHDAQHDKESGLLLMVLEFGEIDLEQLLQQAQEQNLSLNFVRNYWEQMLQSVQAIHEENIIHSDLKPANFLLVGGCLKLIDFGIAKAIPNDTTNIQRDCQTGTLNYMAPEAINYAEVQGTKQSYLKQGRASDVWSLGCILYRFIYHAPPFGNLPWMSKIQKITDPNHVIHYAPTEDKDVISAIKGCLVYEPKKRLTIPELLAHPFLHANGPGISKDQIRHILSLGLDLHVDFDNIGQVSEVLRAN